MKKLVSIIFAALLLATTACAAGNGDNSTKSATAQEDNMSGKKIIVTDTGGHRVTFALNSTSPAESLYEMLPLTVEVSNYGSNEKIFYPPKKISFGSDATEGSGGKDT